MSDIYTSPFLNTLTKAQFIKKPEDPDNPEKDKLRKMRADPKKYKKVYNIDHNANK